MSLPSYYAWEVYRGDTGRRGFVLWSDTAKTQPVDLTGVTAAAWMHGYEPTHVTMACVITGNRIDVTLSPADSRTLPSAAAWDLQLTYAGGDVRTIVQGPVMVTGDVTESVVPETVELSHV